MRKLNKLIICLVAFCFILTLSVTVASAQLKGKLDSIATIYKTEIPNVSNIKALEISDKMENPFKEKYVMFIEQPIDHSNPAKGTYKQRVIVSIANYNAPTVIVTEGYGAAYALNPRYREEISRFFNTNIVVVEHRYFLESIPFKQQDSTITDETLDWSYMNAPNQAADLHNVAQLFKKILPGKWIATGISKGGQTTMFYTAYYPNDIDVSVPYVGPLCKGAEDGRHEPFLANYVGTAEDRAIIKAFQTEFLKRRDKIRPLFEALNKEKGYTYKIPLDAVYDYCVLEFPFAFWQWGNSTAKLPNPATATDKEMFNALVRASGPDYFAEGSDTAPFFVQAATELGYYGYDATAFKGLLTITDTKGYLNKLFVPQSQTFKFNDYLYKKVSGFLEKTNSKMMFIYGQYDPWSSVMPVAPVKNEELKAKGKGRNTMVLFIKPGGSHSSRISNLPNNDKEAAINQLKEWLEIK
ncbi:MAG: S28 family serine protease [Bacteroidales bacterium]